MNDRFVRGCALVLLLAAACGGKAVVPLAAPEKPKLEAWQPGDELQRVDQALKVVFDQEMVSIEAVGPTLSPAPIAVEPALPLRVHWEDRRTLIVEAESEWRAGERYTASLLEPLVSQLSNRAQGRFVFDAQPLRIQGTSLPRHNADTSPSFAVYFSLPVDPAAAASQCALAAVSGERQAVSLLPREKYDSPAIVRLKSERPLPLATRFMLRCDGLKPSAGTAPVRYEPDAVSFTTHGLLTLPASWPKPDAPLPPERAELCLAFSTPVELEQLAKHVHVTPQPEGLEQSWYQDGCIPYDEAKEDDTLETHRKSSLLLAPRKHYRVEIDAALQDTFGQQLGQPQRYEFDTADRIPGLWTATGTGIVLELGRQEHALGALNLDSVSALCLPLTAAKLAGWQKAMFEWS